MLKSPEQPLFDHPLVRRLWTAGNSLMRNDIAYHNTQHPLDTEAAAIKIIQEAIPNDITVDPLVVSLGSLTHDFLYHKPLDKVRHPSKEVRTIEITDSLLLIMAADTVVRKGVSLAIEGTEAGKKLTTNEARVVRKADLINLGYDRSHMLRFTSAYAYEFTEIGDTLPDTWDKWSGFAREKLIELTTGDDLFYTRSDGTTDDTLLFPEVVYENIDLLKLPFDKVRAICAEKVEPVSPTNPMGHYFDMLPWAA